MTRVLKGDWLTTGPTVEKFEAAFAARVGSRFAVACSSGTAALHLATLALRLGPGDRAVVPSTTFLATANAVSYVGANVIFADVEAETGLMNERFLEAAIASVTGRVRAVLPVHLAGQIVDMPALARAAAKYDLAVIEDACHALGTTYRDGDDTVTVGSCRHSVMAIFSFHPVKIIAMGEGGAVTTNDPALYARLMRLRNHGLTREPRDFRNSDLAIGADGTANSWYYEMPEIGFNYRASDIHCALALSQLGKLDDFIARRRELAECYDRRLAALAPWVLAPKRVPDCVPAWHLYPARINFTAIGISKEQLIRKLKARGIGTQVHYIPVHLQPYYQDRLGSLQLPGSMAYYRSTLSLPLFPSMTENDVARVVDAIATCVPSR